MSGVSIDLACELLAQSLATWRVAGVVQCSDDGAIVIGEAIKDIRIAPALPGSMFRWTVTIDRRERRAISLAAVLRQVREALDPSHGASRVRVAISPLVAVPPI